MSKPGFFTSRSYIGRDSGFLSKIGRIPTKSGWLNSLLIISLKHVDLNNLSIEDLKKKKKKHELKKEFNDYNEQKEKLIAEIDETQKQRKDIKKQKPKISSKPGSKPKPKSKTFDDYFEECIRNKKIPKDSPSYLKKALERAMKEYDVGIKHEKSISS